jgi:hypothetical protein
MKKEAYVAAICKPFCSFYKQGKEGLACGGYKLLTGHLTLRELKRLAGRIEPDKGLSAQIPSRDRLLEELVCEHCDFLADGCDYAADRSGPPCGGYILIHRLLNTDT